METPNETNPYVTGYAYAGNDETESDSWITKIVDAPRGADDDSKRLVYIDDDIAETVDTKTASKLNTKYGNHCADYCATSDQLFEGKFNYEKFGKRLAANDKDIEFVEGMIVSKNENVINHVADILDALGFTATTGYYDPAEDKKAKHIRKIKSSKHSKSIYRHLLLGGGIFVCYTHKTKGVIIHGMLERYLQRVEVADFLR